MWEVCKSRVTGPTDSRDYVQGVIDTGTGYIDVPPIIYSKLQSDSSSALQIELMGQNGQPVTLTLGAGSGLMSKGYVQRACSYMTGFMIGFPLWKYYYTVIDVDNKEMTFIDS